MRFKIFPKVLLILGFSLLFIIIKYQDSIKENWSGFIEKTNIYSDNFFFPSGHGPIRRRPVSMLEKETELKLYVGDPFRGFNEGDWEDFWGLVYSSFLKDDPKNPGALQRMRQLTWDEVAFELMSRYPQQFAFFKTEHWNMLFGIIQEK